MSPFLAFRITRVSAWVGLAVLTGLLLRHGEGRFDSFQGVRVRTDVRTFSRDGRQVWLDVYQPATSGPPRGRPALIAIHGGGWRGGSKTDYGRSLLPLVRHGFVVVAVDYRLSRPGVASWPGNLHDVRAAVRWVREHSGVLEIDPDRIAAIGASAGAQLALMLGSYSDENPAGVAAIIDFYGPCDLRSLAAEGLPTAEPVRLLLGGAFESLGSLPDEASPVDRVSGNNPPTLVVHGSDDALIPLDQSRRLVDALKRFGIRNRLIVVEGARHGFGLQAGTVDLIPEVVAFLDSVWNLPNRQP